MSEARVLERRPVMQGRVFEIAVERVALPGGRETTLEILHHPGAAAIVAVNGRDEVLLIRQFRHAAGGELWEIPAGTRDAGEEPLECARRELIEETGFAAGRWEDLGSMLPVPGYSTEQIYLYFARDLEERAQALDEDEVIAEVRAVPAAQALAWASDGTIVDAKTIVGLFRAQRRGLLGLEEQR